MKRLWLILSLCACLLLLPACGTDAPPAATAPPSESATASASNPVTEPETAPIPDGFDAVRASEEPWLRYGLEAYLAEEKAPDLAEFFKDPANLSWLTLYADSFAIDEEKAIPVAESFFRFVADTYGKDALTDVSRRVELKTAYLASLGLDTAYPQLPEVEETLARMTLSSNEDWPYVLTLDNTSYHFKDFSQGSATQYRGIIYHNTTGLAKMIAYLKQTLPDVELDSGRHFDYYMTLDGTGLSFTLSDGRMSINDTYSILHESIHAMGLRSPAPKCLWLSEGLCNYFGRLQGFNEQYAAANIQIMKLVASGAFDERAENGDVTAVFYKQIYNAYVEAGGRVSTTAEFDLVLYNDLWAALERSVTGHTFVTIADAYKAVNGKEYDAPGMELSYAEATSLVCYLVETYGLDTVMTAYEKQDIDVAFGKSYEELLALWMESLPTVAVPLSNRP